MIAIYNLPEAWGELKHSTLLKAWNKLLKGEEFDIGFEGFQASDFRSLLQKARETTVSEQDVHDWIDTNEAIEGNEQLSKEQIMATVTGAGSDEDSEERDMEQAASSICLHMPYLCL